jgi:uncharacterized protein YdeI (YjbR/CyaY-like superfamily)
VPGRPAARASAAEHFERVEVRSAAELRAWLAAHHARPEGVWLVTHRKHTGAAYVSRDAVLDELLCFGWVDGAGRKLDDDRTLQLISPRRTHAWTGSYRRRAARLDAEGRLAEPGRRAIALARASGGWEARPDVDALVVPDDLGDALAARGDARAWWDAAAPSYRRNVLRWIAKAQRPETRARRVERVAELAERGEKVPQL